MVSFRRNKNKGEMEEKAEAVEGRAAEREPEKIRVTDRRRIHVDESGGVAREEGEEPSEPRLKPTYVEELEARTRAAEQQARDVQTRFEQVRAELRRETDEVRQRLTRAG
jgi:hypothetical protein